MKVFLSWSGDRSQKIANFLSDWLCCVLQACRPWISTRDIDRGAIWFGELHDQLKDTSVGIICLTNENKNKPWILFEAGALAKGLSTTRVCTFLIDLEPKDIQDPLAQFNHTFPNKQSVYSLVRTLNQSLGELSLVQHVMDAVFDTYWPQFEDTFNKILSETNEKIESPSRPEQDILGEILETTRRLNSRMRGLEKEFETRNTSLTPFPDKKTLYYSLKNLAENNSEKQESMPSINKTWSEMLVDEIMKPKKTS